VVIATCVLSYVLLINAVNKSRVTFAEMIQTKREMWKVIAQKNAAEQASRERTEFISIASHELRTPLYAISGFTELLEHSHLTEEQYSYVHAIKTASLTVKIITDNVLDFSRLENNVLAVCIPLTLVCRNEGSTSLCRCPRACLDFCAWDLTSKRNYGVDFVGEK
jgi:signal transduction histidine kinase